MSRYSNGQLARIVDAALQEDWGSGDVTTDALIAADMACSARLVAREAGVVAGLDVARAVFRRVDAELEWSGEGVDDGDIVAAGAAVARVDGGLASVLKAERTALNFMQRMSGIATLTARYVEAVASTAVSIADTRKTAPGLRILDKYAVALGGGRNHRGGLADGVLIKDNHIRALTSQRNLSWRQIVTRAKERAPHILKVEVEADTAEMAAEAALAGADAVMLDNMAIDEMRRAVELIDGQCLVEASGGVTLENVLEVAETGVDVISVGELTHSPRALDIALEVGEPR